jgi:glycosyltransferase involved in cell wall biosynthesis
MAMQRTGAASGKLAEWTTSMPTVNILSKDNGAGLSRNIRLLGELLGNAGFTTCLTVISEKDLRRSAVCAGQLAVPLAKRLKCRARRWLARRGIQRRRFDVNLFMETVLPDWFAAARSNCLVPNPEWFEPWWRDYLPQFEIVLCKTRHAEQIFRDCGARVEFISFTSGDRFQADVRREDRAALHVAGTSLQKGTGPLLQLWRSHPEWPKLTVVGRGETIESRQAPNIDFRVGLLDDAELRILQNRHAIHVCPSETEGFGHSLVEAMSCRATVITTDAPPMNEIIAPGRGLLARAGVTSRQRLATNFHVDPRSLEHQIEAAIHLDLPQRIAMGEAARHWFDTNRQFFSSRIVRLLSELVDHKRRAA